MITMNMDLINPYMIRIIIAVREGDSIRAISQRIQVSYAWTYKWTQALAKIGVFRIRRAKIEVNQTNEFYGKTIKYIQEVLAHDIAFYYAVLDLFGVSYCFTKTDAVFMWTKGGYNIARYKAFYPIFIKIQKKDKKIFESYCKKLQLNTEKRKNIFYDVHYVDKMNQVYKEGIPIDPLEETITFMEKNAYNFEPALEMIKEMYGKKISSRYKEVVTNV